MIIFRMGKKKITKKEKKFFISLLFSVFIFALLAQPVSGLLGKIFVNPTLRIIIGVILAVLFLWYIDVS